MKIYSGVTPSLHPAVIEHIGNFNLYEGYLRQAREAYETAYKGLSAIHEARRSARGNPTLNEAAQLLAVADLAGKKQDSILAAFDRARGNLEAAVKTMEATLNEPMKAATQSPIHAEIRAHVKSLSDSDRSAFMSQALSSGDTQTLSAVLGAPGYLSNMNEDIRTAYTRQFHKTQNPELAKRLDATKEAIALIDKGAGLVFNEVTKAIGADWKEINEIKRAKIEAEKAFRDA